MTDVLEFNIRNVSDQLKGWLVDDAEAAESNMNDIAVGILARHYDIPFEPSGRRSYAGRAGGPIILNLPIAIHERLEAAARRTRTRPKTSKERVALAILHAHYGLPYSPPLPNRRRRRRREAEAAA